MESLPNSMVNELNQKVTALVEKYAVTYAEVAKEITATEKSLSAIIDDLTGNDFDMQGLAELQNLLTKTSE
jgi:type I restriction enzyme M protein